MDAWPQVRALEGRTLHTLDRHRPFQVLTADDHQVLIRLSTGKTRVVSRDQMTARSANWSGRARST